MLRRRGGRAPTRVRADDQQCRGDAPSPATLAVAPAAAAQKSAGTLPLMSRRLLACFVALASVTGALATFATTTPASAAPATGLSAWRACGGKLQCATLTV